MPLKNEASEVDVAQGHVAKTDFEPKEWFYAESGGVAQEMGAAQKNAVLGLKKIEISLRISAVSGSGHDRRGAEKRAKKIDQRASRKERENGVGALDESGGFDEKTGGFLSLIENAESGVSKKFGYAACVHVRITCRIDA